MAGIYSHTFYSKSDARGHYANVETLFQINELAKAGLIGDVTKTLRTLRDTTEILLATSVSRD